MMKGFALLLLMLFPAVPAWAGSVASFSFTRAGQFFIAGQLPDGVAGGTFQAHADALQCQGAAIVTLFDCGTDSACKAYKPVASLMLYAPKRSLATKLSESIVPTDTYAWSIAGNCTSLSGEVRAISPAAVFKPIVPRKPVVPVLR